MFWFSSRCMIQEANIITTWAASLRTRRIYSTGQILDLLLKISVRVPQILEQLKAYMIVNFRTREISRDTHKLTQIPMLIIIIKKNWSGCSNVVSDLHNKSLSFEITNLWSHRCPRTTPIHRPKSNLLCFPFPLTLPTHIQCN